MAVVTQLNHKKELRSVPPPQLPSIVDIKNAIPAHCFTKDTFTSVRYLIQDLLLMAALYLILSPVEHYFGWLGLLAWYWAYGFVGFALFLIGHDTGHGSFSDYEWLNDICGHIAHAPLLVPYWPWQKSHRQHHQFTAHLEKDRGHAWITEKKYNSRSWLKRSFAAFPLSGWLIFTPLYTVFGWPDGSHYWPFSRLFDNNIERLKCAFSATCCLLCGYTAYALLGYSLYNWFKYYYIPLSFQGFVLYMVTYLQHRDVDIEVYEPEEWQFVRGQTQTIDRKYGFGLDTLMHHVTDGHVAHHFFFTKIPHYHLIDATEGIKKVLKPYENTPYGYKSESNYDFFFKFMHYRTKLDYLINKSKGVLQHRVGVEGERAARKNH